MTTGEASLRTVETMQQEYLHLVYDLHVSEDKPHMKQKRDEILNAIRCEQRS